MNEYDEMNNSELQQNARDIHGALYKRINKLQRDLNVANALANKYNNLYQDMSARYGEKKSCHDCREYRELLLRKIGSLIEVQNS